MDYKYQWSVPSGFARKVLLGTGLMEKLEQAQEIKEESMIRREQKNGDGRKVRTIIGIPKLVDASLAGGEQSLHCSTFLTEGDSAKSLVCSALSILGHAYYGVMPLKGVGANVLEMSEMEILANKEISSIRKISGCRIGVDYSKDKNMKDLRIGRYIIFTDPDEDGYHIKALLILLFVKFWPELIARGFLTYFIVPIRTCKKGPPGEKQIIVEHYNESEHDAWLDATDGGKGFTIRQNKGLASIETSDMIRYCKNLDFHIKTVTYDKLRDGDLLDMIFRESRADDRKQWLSTINSVIEKSRQSSYYKQPIVDVKTIIECEISKWMDAVNKRTLSKLDGLKDSTRKLADSMLYRHKASAVETKISSLSGFVADQEAYHHGNVSLEQTIIKSTFNFVGRQNFNFMDPYGQVGSRASGGKDAGNSRYVFTSLNPTTHILYPKKDLCVLDWNWDNGKRREPKLLYPVLCALLMYGGKSTGCAWSSSIPCFNVDDIASCTMEGINQIKDDDPRAHDLDKMYVFSPNIFKTQIMPYYRGFKGTILPAKGSYIDSKTGRPTQTYICEGIIKKLDDLSFEISELPLKWTDDYTKMLDDMANPSKPSYMIERYEQQHSILYIKYVVYCSSAQMNEILAKGDLHKTFRLKSNVLLNNMVAYDTNDNIKLYNDVYEIIAEQMTQRFHAYKKRKVHELKDLESEWEILENKARFIKMSRSGEIKTAVDSSSILVQQLCDLKFKPVDPTKNKLTRNKKTDENENQVKDDDNDDDQEILISGSNNKIPLSHYSYLIKMPINKMVLSQANELQSQADAKKVEYEDVKKRSPKDVWIVEIQEFLKSYAEHMKKWEDMEYTGGVIDTKKTQIRLSGRKRKTPEKKNNIRGSKVKVKEEAEGVDDDDDDDEFSSENDDDDNDYGKDDSTKDSDYEQENASSSNSSSKKVKKIKKQVAAKKVKVKKDKTKSTKSTTKTSKRKTKMEMD